MKKKQYMKPQVEKLISFENPCLLAGTENWDPNPSDPAAKKNL